MEMALTGALVGLALAVGMYAFDYMALRAHAAERAKRLFKKTAEFDASERKRLAGLLRFCFIVPPGCAFFAWLIWG